MKASILTIGIFSMTMIFTVASCSSSAENVDDAKDQVNEANEELEKANEAYEADMEDYKRISEEKIATNQKSIEDFNKKISAEKKEAKADYEKRIAELEAQNNSMKKRMEDYQAEGKEQWEIFKTDFNRDMDELGEALKNLTTNPKK